MGVWWSGAGETGGNITNVSPPGGGGPPGGGTATAGIGQAYESSGQSMDEWIQEALGPTGDVHDVSGVETVDYTSDPVQEDLITEADKWDWFNELQGAWEGSGSNPLYPYDENYDELGVSSPYAMQGMAFDPHSSQWYATQGGAISPAWQGATEGEPGAVLVDGDWKKPILSGLGSHFMESDDLWSGGAPDLSDPAVMENIKDIQQDYYANVHPSSQPDTDEPVSWGGGGGGSGGGSGYYGDPRKGNPLDRYGNFFTPQANLQRAAVNVFSTPTGFRGVGQPGFQMKRGGIVSLLRMN